MLDLCTGSGHLAILSSKFLNCNKVFASDICDKAIEIAKLNVSLNNDNKKSGFKIQSIQQIK